MFAAQEVGFDTYLSKMSMVGSVSSIIQRGGDSKWPEPFWSPYLLSFSISAAAWAPLLASCHSESTEDPRLTRRPTHKVQLPPSPQCSHTNCMRSPPAQGLTSCQDHPGAQTCFSLALMNPKSLQTVNDMIGGCFWSTAALPMNRWINMQKQSVGLKLKENIQIIMNRY